MKKILRTLCGGLALCAATLGTLPAAGQTTTATGEITATETATLEIPVSVSAATGTLTGGGPLYYHTWTSASFPGLTLTNSGANNIENVSGTLNLFSSANGNREYKFAVTGDTKIKSLTIGLKNRTSGQGTTTVKVGDQSVTLTDTEQTVTLSNQNTASISLTIVEANVWAAISSCTVTLEHTTKGRAFEVNTTTGSLNNSNGYSKVWTSTSTDPQLIMSASANNMNTSGTSINVWSGKPQYTSNYTFSAGSTYAIAGYLLTFKKAANTNTITVTANGTSIAVSDTVRSIFVEGLSSPVATYVVAGSNEAVTLEKATVLITTRSTSGEQTTDLFISNALQTNPYRIPAIAKTHNGDLLAICDYRAGLSDVGYGLTSLVGKISKDNGKTWGNEFNILKGTGTTGQYDMSFGDAALVADAESDTVLLMCASGCTGFFQSTRSNPIRVTRKYSFNNGTTWQDSTNVTEDLYKLFDNMSGVTMNGLFFTSGRIFQSSIIKEGTHRRIYAVLCCRDNASNTSQCNNYVVYSDNLGQSWHILGGANGMACLNGNEAKCEELPDGTVILSSRTPLGRYFNYFSYTDVAKGEGSWGTVANATSAPSQPQDGSSSGCNGEILIVPAKKVSTGEELYVALQSIPAGPQRSNVRIYYKELSSLADLSDPAAFITAWDGYYQVTAMNSAYSTMCVQANDSIAFFYEESTYGYDYTNVYKQYNLERITGGAYSYYAGVNRTAFVKKIMEERLAALEGMEQGLAIGQVSYAKYDAAHAAVKQTIASLEDDADAQDFVNATVAVNKALADIYVTPVEGVDYTWLNKLHSDKYLSASTDKSQYTGSTTATYAPQKFRFVKAGEGQWYVYNDSLQTYLNTTQATYAHIPQTSDKSSAGVYTLTSTSDGWTVLTCTSPVNSGIPCPHLSGENYLVSWTTTAEASMWKIVPCDDHATERTALVEAITAARKYEVGTTLSTYADADDTFTSALASATTAASTVLNQTATALTSAQSTLTAAQGKLTLNMPASGMFLRVKASKEWKATQPYLRAETTTTGGKGNVAAFGEKEDAISIFYFADGKLLSYKSGYYAASTASSYGFLTFTGVDSDTPISFRAATNGTPCRYNMLFCNGSRQAYTGDSSTDSWANAAGNTASGEGYNFTLENVTKIPLTVSSAGYATFHCPVQVSLPDSVTAYTATRMGDYLTLQATGSTIPASTPVIIEAKPGTYYFTLTNGEDSKIESNLTGTVASVSKTEDTYTLQQPEGEPVGFYSYTGSILYGFKAYVPASVAEGAHGLIFSPVTAVSETPQAAPCDPAAIYDLQGRRVSKAGKGIYIIGGKKVIRF